MKIENVLGNIKRHILKTPPDQAIDYFLTFLLIIVAYRTIANSFQQQIFESPKFLMFGSINILIILMGASALWFYFRKKDLRFILALIAIATGIYINTYPGEYIPGQDISSMVQIKKSENISFTSLYTHIMFKRDKTILTQKLQFNTYHFPVDVESYYEFNTTFNPPKSTIGYKINITGNISKLNNSKLITIVKPILNKTNDSITDKSFPELKGQNFSLDRMGKYTIDITYNLSKIEPRTRVYFRLWGNQEPMINDSSFKVMFSDLLYGCMTPCIVSYKEDTEIYPSDQRVLTSKDPVKDELYTIYLITAKDSNEIEFFIRGTNKFAVVLRNFMLAIIAGLTLMMMNIFIKKRNTYFSILRGYYDSILKYFNKSLKINKELGSKIMASVYGSIGNVYQKKGDLDKTLEHYNKSLEINKELGSKEGMANQYGNIGIVYQKKGDLEKAAEYYKKSLIHSDEAGYFEGLKLSVENLKQLKKETKLVEEILKKYPELKTQ